MREFDYAKLKKRTWDSEILGYVAQIHECKGRQQLYLRQQPVGLERLVEIAKIQSTEASNAIENIRTSNSFAPRRPRRETGMREKSRAIVMC